MKAHIRPGAIFLAIAVLLLAGCTSHVYYPLESRAVPVSRAPAMEIFDFRPEAGRLVLDDSRSRRRGYAMRRFTMPASFENGQPGNLLTGTYYASSLPGRRPLVIILPVWGVSEYPSRSMAGALVRRSRGRMNILRVDGKRRLMPWQSIARSETPEQFAARLSNAAARLRHAVIDARRLVDWAEQRREIDPDRIGLVGFSISAVTGSLVVQSDHRIRAAALVMGGAEISRIVSRCPGNEEETRTRVMRTLGLELSEYEAIIRRVFRGLDPADYPHRVDPSSILLVDAGKDDCIPRASREAWWDALGRPERISMNYSHRGSFLAMTPLGFNFLKRRVYQHLARRL
ncbi:MAG TPA: hypothetical protein VK973_14945 [Arenicellales bacterium]|nr:hypothetical protein [Arenicellales bacterium]